MTKGDAMALGGVVASATGFLYAFLVAVWNMALQGRESLSMGLAIVALFFLAAYYVFANGIIRR